MIKAGEGEVQGLIKLYREFSRLRYNKYKHKYPKLKENELISKVQKEWDAMGEDEKRDLEKHYQDKNYLAGDSYLPEALGTRRGGRGNASKMVVQKSKDSKKSRGASPAHKLKIIEDLPDQVVDVSESDEARSDKKPRFDSDSDRQEPRNNVTKKIKKSTKVKSDTKNRQYLAFYKYYYDKLGKQHVKWKPSQISVIIKLLWKKRIVTQKRDNVLKKKAAKTGKGKTKKAAPKRTTAYLTFKKGYQLKHGPGTDVKTVKGTWRRLTYERKQILSREAQIANNQHFAVKVRASDESKSKISKLINEGHTEYKPLSFLNKTMSYN